MPLRPARKRAPMLPEMMVLKALLGDWGLVVLRDVTVNVFSYVTIYVVYRYA
jgi:hypothetical protein